MTPEPELAGAGSSRKAAERLKAEIATSLAVDPEEDGETSGEPEAEDVVAETSAN